jgi:hypothetical protein
VRSSPNDVLYTVLNVMWKFNLPPYSCDVLLYIYALAEYSKQCNAKLQVRTKNCFVENVSELELAAVSVSYTVLIRLNNFLFTKTDA